MNRIRWIALTAILASPAAASDIAAYPGALVPAPVPAPAPRWEGFYLGVHAGYGWGETDYSAVYSDVNGDLAYGPILGTIDLDGMLAGVQAGYSWQRGQLVYGLEADAAWTNVEGSVPAEEGSDSLAVHQLDWLATLRGRVGVDLDRFLPYLTGGLAVAGSTASITNFQGFDDVRTVHPTFVGWTIGAGVETALSANLSLKLEYLYADLGPRDVDYGLHTNLGPNGPHTLVADTETALHTVKIGINYRFAPF